MRIGIKIQIKLNIKSGSDNSDKNQKWTSNKISKT